MFVANKVKAIEQQVAYGTQRRRKSLFVAKCSCKEMPISFAYSPAQIIAESKLNAFDKILIQNQNIVREIILGCFLE